MRIVQKSSGKRATERASFACARRAHVCSSTQCASLNTTQVSSCKLMFIQGELGCWSDADCTQRAHAELHSNRQEEVWFLNNITLKQHIHNSSRQEPKSHAYTLASSWWLQSNPVGRCYDTHVDLADSRLCGCVCRCAHVGSVAHSSAHAAANTTAPKLAVLDCHDSAHNKP